MMQDFQDEEQEQYDIAHNISRSGGYYHPQPSQTFEDDFYDHWDDVEGAQYGDWDLEDYEPGPEGYGLYAGRGTKKGMVRRAVKGARGARLAYDDLKSRSRRRIQGRGLAQSEKFVPFGRYLINQHRLGNDIIAIKRPAGSVIKKLPSTRVSLKVGNVIRKIVGHGLPTYEELEDLDDNEREYLNDLAHESHIADRLEIPAPRKNEKQKQMDRFEVLKGEMIAGNDNQEMVKEFKKLLLNLGNKDLIPKGQMRDILFDLTSMGY